MIPVLLPLAAWASLSAAAPSCREMYRNSFYEDAEITKPEWDLMCETGENPGSYRGRRYVEKQGRIGKKEKDKAVVKMFLDIPVEELKPDQSSALAEVDLENLEPNEKDAYVAWREEVLAKRLGAPSGRKTCVKGAQEKVERQAKVWAKSGHEEITWDECDWLSKTIECNFDDMEKALQFHMIYDCKKHEYRCFLHVKDPIFSYIGVYRGGGRTRQDVGGTATFGIDTAVSCKKGSFDEFLKKSDAQ